MGKSNINFWGLITNPERTLLWFMYAIIGIYIALPFMRRMVENMTKREDVLFIMLWITCNGVLHLLKFFFNLSVKYPVPILNGTYYLGYFMVGYLIGKYRVFIEDYFKKVRIRCMGWSLCTLAFVATVCFTYFNSVFEDKYFRYFLKYNSLFTIIASVAFFILVYTGCKNKSNKLIKILATNSFEVYLFHGIILDFVMINTPFRFMNSFWGIPLLSLVIFIVTFLGVSAVKSSVLILKKRKL